ncbi:MAG: hypothetical protein OEV78_08505 [Spirochaetia bacterium]|nr:hypothetical protein [Spirochaetia bacterium]
MEILVNDKPLDFELEKTLSLTELLENIQNWALKENLFILDYRVNGETIENEIDTFNSDNIQSLEVNLGSKQTLIWENISELQNYFLKIVTYLIPRLQETSNLSGIDSSQLHEGIQWTIKSLTSIKKYFAKSESAIHEIDEQQLLGASKGENYVQLISIIKAILQNINDCKKQLFYNMLDNINAADLKNMYLSELSSVISKLEEIASDLTIGKDVKALNALENIIEWLSIGILVFEKSGSDVLVIEQIKKTLNDLDDSLKNSDFVSLADIIDFDLRDSLSALLH